jgi:translation initiation factor IF-2
LRHNKEIKTFDIIYEVVDWVAKELNARRPKEEVEEITGTAKIVRVFSINKNKQIVGGIVEAGEIQSNEVVRILRRDAIIGEGKIKELQSQKIKTSAVAEGKEFGMMIDSKTEIVPGDRISGFKITNR